MGPFNIVTRAINSFSLLKGLLVTKNLTRREAFGLLSSTLLLSACSGGNIAGSNGSVESESTSSANEDSEYIDVKVVAARKESYESYDISEKWFETSYTYDKAGRLIQTDTTDPFGITDENTKPGWRHEYEYDEAGRVSSVSWYAEYIDWGLSFTEAFTYNEDGTCATYDTVIRSQGMGTSHFEYTYDETGRVTSAKEIEGDGISEYESELVWAYDDKGRVTKATLTKSTGYGDYGIGLDETLSNNDAGVYVYRDTRGSSFTLRYDEDGYLVSSEEGTGWPRRKEYSYKIIKVKRSEWIPSIYSVPSGLDIRFEPQVSAEMKARLLNE